MDIKDVSNDMLGNIMSHLEGAALASVACTCSHLHELALDQTLWKRLCHSAWPSTTLQQVDGLISSSVGGGFTEFYASSLPLIAYNDEAPSRVVVDRHASASDLVSFVDVFVDDKCVLSRVLDGIPLAVDVLDDDRRNLVVDSERQRWFMSCPFRWDCLDQDQDQDLLPVDDNSSSHEDQSQDLNRSLRLSWILMEKKSGKTVNLSSWKPISVHRSWPYSGNYVAQFGCVVPVQPSVLPHKMANCSITAKFKMDSNCLEGSFAFRELSLGIQDIEGSQVNGDGSLKILNQALYSTRSRNQLKVERGYLAYEEAKSRIFKQKESTETLANRLYMLIEIAAFLGFSFTLKSLF